MVNKQKDQYTVVLEDIRDNLRAFGESLQFVHKDIKEIKQVQDSHTEMIGKLAVNVTEIKNALKTKADAKTVLKIAHRVSLLEKKA